MIAHCAKHPGLQISKGHVVGKAASVDLGVDSPDCCSRRTRGFARGSAYSRASPTYRAARGSGWSMAFPKTRAESPTSQAARGCVLTSKAIPWRQRARVLCRARVPGAAIKRGYFEVSAYERARSHRDEGTGRTIPAPASGPANSRAGQHGFHSSRFSFRFPQCVSLRSGFERPFDVAVQTTQHPDA